METAFQFLIPILLPIISGLLIGYLKPLRNPIMQRLFFLTVLILNSVLVLYLSFMGNKSFELFRLTERLPILFRNDDLARFFCVLTSTMFVLVGIYCPEYMRHEANEHRFYMFYLMVLGMMMGFGLSANLMTLYLFLEILTFISIPLVLHSMKKEAIAAAYKYLYYSIAGAAMVLIGFFFVYTYGTTINFTPGGVIDLHMLAGRENQILVFTMLTIIGFGAKAGMYPLHAWLPIAHPVAPSPASAILSGIITKIGIFATIRFVYYLIGPDQLRGTWMQTAWISLALFTSIMGSMLAFREPVLKRRLAYSTISQIGYIQLGLGILTKAGLIGALLHMVFHSIAKNALFLIAGIIIIKTHKTNVSELGGIGKKMPALISCFALLAITLAGIPPTAGFISKWQLISGLLEADIGFFTWLGPAVLLVCALLAAFYLFPIVIDGFFVNTKLEKVKLEFSMLLPVILLAAAAIIFGLFPDVLISFSERIAGELL